MSYTLGNRKIYVFDKDYIVLKQLKNGDNADLIYQDNLYHNVMTSLWKTTNAVDNIVLMKLLMQNYQKQTA
jgi:hypothetical protein